MAITAVTTWEGTPTAMELVVAGSKAAVELHESLGAKNARLLRDSHGGRGVAQLDRNIARIDHLPIVAKRLVTRRLVPRRRERETTNL